MNEPPVADAGLDQTVVDSDGSGSEDVVPMDPPARSGRPYRELELVRKQRGDRDRRNAHRGVRGSRASGHAYSGGRRGCHQTDDVVITVEAVACPSAAVVDFVEAVPMPALTDVQASAVAVSSDGAHVYATAGSGNALVAFEVPASSHTSRPCSTTRAESMV